MSNGAKKGMANDDEQPTTVPLTTPKPDLARRIERNRQDAFRRRRQKQWRIAGIFLLAALAVGSLAYWWHSRGVQQRSEITVKEEPLFQVKGQTISDDYVLTRAFLGLENDPKITILIFDFDAHRFLKGKDSVDNPENLKQVFQREQTQLQSALIVIFAGASFEDDPDENRGLCRRRVHAVARIMREAGISGKSYWGIVAGEFKEANSTDSDEETAEENKAKQMGEDKLAAQRRLIVIAVTPKKDFKDEQAQEELNTLFKTMREKGLLPTNYDHGEADPSRITELP